MKTAAIFPAAVLASVILPGTAIRTGANPERGPTPVAVKLPKDFPSDVPVYPAATVATTTTSPGTMTVVLSTTDKTAKVEGYYDEHLKAEGWTIENTMHIENTALLQAKKNSRQCHVLIGDNDDKTFISLTVIDGD